MEGLDFSALTDDQLLGLLRAAAEEALRRSPSCGEAARAIAMDAAERARIVAGATEREQAALRAEMRERIAREAREAERAKHALADAERAAQIAEKDIRDRKKILKAIADGLGVPPGSICASHAYTRSGQRVMVNSGNDRFANFHLVDWYVKSGKIATSGEHKTKKVEMARLCGILAARFGLDTFISGSDYSWEDAA